MRDFTYYAPTDVVFGRDSEEKIAELVRRHDGTKLLLHYGGQSAQRSGLLDKVRGALNEAGIAFIELGGVVPNPRLSLVHKGIELCRKEGVNMLLAVGGGSVIDSSKAIAYGVPYEGEVWDFYAGSAKAETALPVGCVVTNPASGSEMSDSCVITNDFTSEKRGYSSPYGRARFSVLNPERTFTLPAAETAAGIADIMMHTMERYFSPEMDMALTESMAEALLRTVRDSALKLLEDPQDYQARAQVMWAGSLAHNGLTGCGLQGDWVCHKMEHELSALFDVRHGDGLTALWPTWARYVYRENLQRFVRFAVNVMGVQDDPADPERVALEGIAAMESFYRKLNLPVNIPELMGGRALGEDELREMAGKCSRGGTFSVGAMKLFGEEQMLELYRLANRNA